MNRYRFPRLLALGQLRAMTCTAAGSEDAKVQAQVSKAADDFKKLFSSRDVNGLARRNQFERRSHIGVRTHRRRQQTDVRKVVLDA